MEEYYSEVELKFFYKILLLLRVHSGQSLASEFIKLDHINFHPPCVPSAIEGRLKIP